MIANYEDPLTLTILALCVVGAVGFIIAGIRAK